MTLVDTPNAKTIAELVEQFNLPIENRENPAGESG
jgi:prolyl-tRNA synthetase